MSVGYSVGYGGVFEIYRRVVVFVGMNMQGVGQLCTGKILICLDFLEYALVSAARYIAVINC